MTATKKLIIAAVLLAAGFGVARLMGRPDAPWLATHTGNIPAASRNEIKGVNPIVGAAPSAAMENGARLVPDFSAENPYRVRPDSSASNKLEASKNEVNASVAPPPLKTNSDYQPSRQGLEPRAKLRDEAPRPLEFDSRGPATAYTCPALPLQTGAVVPVAEARSAAADWRASGLTPAEFIQAAKSDATINATYNQPVYISARLGTVAPPPWPESAEDDGPRTHVVVDGDSLERLAARYLDDPNRGNEIYEANRELLASPDLLPIGAQLIIPKRASRTAFESASPQSSLASDPSLRAATHGGMARVRPIPSAVNVLPRAQLLPPVRAE